jgi:hypothetical protein
MSEEPEIIHSNRPHQVSIPEGSHVAVAKTGTPQEPSVHKNYRPGTAQESEQAPDRYSPDTLQEPTARMAGSTPAEVPDRTNLAKTPLQTPVDRMASDVPAAKPASGVTPAAPPAQVPPPPAPASAQDSSSAVDSSIEHDALPEHEMPEMDFPARVVHLRIENEELRTRLDNLETDR